MRGIGLQEEEKTIRETQGHTRRLQHPINKNLYTLIEDTSVMESV